MSKANQIRAYAAMKAGEQLVPYQFDAGELQAHQVEVKVEYCGLCHSDISVINNDWQFALSCDRRSRNCGYD